MHHLFLSDDGTCFAGKAFSYVVQQCPIEEKCPHIIPIIVPSEPFRPMRYIQYGSPFDNTSSGTVASMSVSFIL